MPETQTRLAGTEDEVHADVTSAAQAYVEVRDRRMKLAEEEMNLRDRLSEKMSEHDLTFYKDEDAGLEVRVETPDAKVKVKRLKDEE